MKDRISFTDIIQRKRFLNMESESAEKNIELFVERYENNKNVDNFLKIVHECGKSRRCTNRYYEYIINEAKEFNTPSINYYIATEVAPLSSMIEVKSGYNNIDSIIERNVRCDRILENHNKIDSKSSIESLFEDYKWTDDCSELLIAKCCEAVKDFNVVNRGKIIIALEEFCYLAQKYNIKYDEQSIAESAITYYIFKEGIDNINFEKLEGALKKNVVIEYSDTYSANIIIDSFKSSYIKDSNLLAKVFEDLCDYNDKSFSCNMKDYFELLRHILLSSTDHELVSCIYQVIIPSLKEVLLNKFGNESYFLNYISIMIDIISKEINISNMYIKRYVDEEVVSRFTHYLVALKDSLEDFIDMDNMIYTKYNLECMTFSIQENSSSITLESFKLFKKQNLINALTKADKAIAIKFKNIKDKAKEVFSNIKKKIFTEEVSEYAFLNEEGFIDVEICSYYVESVNKEILQFADDCCRNLNNIELYNTEYNVYYIANENTIHFYIKSNTNVKLTESEMEEYLNYFSESIETDEISIEEYLNYNIPDMSDIIDVLSEFNFTDNNLDFYNTFVAIGELSGINIDIMNEICVSSGYDLVSGSYNPNLYNEEVRLEAIDLMCQLIYEDYKKPEIKSAVKNGKVKTTGNTKESDNVKNITRKPGDPEDTKIGNAINNIKIGLMGLKKKVKDMGSKEQSLSRQADTTFNMFVKSINNALVSDRREAIIKGSVIPSFSRCIKIGIGLIGIGIVTGGPIIPAIGAIGAFAISKNLTKKERTLLLDDIEIELEVLEKEIQSAESRNQLKKLRALLKTKKELQRQYQRIKYNNRIGKEMLPSSLGIER